MVATGRITATNLFFCTVPQIRLLQTIVRVYKLYLLTYLQFVGICPLQKVLLPVVPRTSLLFQNDRYCRFAQLTRKGLGVHFAIKSSRGFASPLPTYFCIVPQIRLVIYAPNSYTY